MTPAPISISIQESVRAAEDLMIDRQVRHLPVVDGETLVGVISDRDLAFTSNAVETGLAERLSVRDVCTLDVYDVTPDEPLDIVLAVMAERRLGSTVVTDGGRIAGIFTATDACRCFAVHLREGAGHQARRPSRRS
jgi:CBS domain-containing protein